MDITVFSTTNCGACHAVMQWLDKQQIAYIKRVVDEDESAMAEFMEVNDGMIGTPFTVIQGDDKITKIAGFDQPKLRAALGV